MILPGYSCASIFNKIRHSFACCRVTRAALATGLTFLLPVALFAAPNIGAASATPNTAVIGVPTPVTVVVAIPDPDLIPASVNLLQLDSTGRVRATLGILADNGTNGDVSAGDKLFSLRVTVNETAPVQFRLQVSAAFRGVLARVRRDVATIFVEPANAAGQAITGLVNELKAGNTIAALQRFTPSPSTIRIISNLSTTAKAALIAALETATLVRSGPDLRAYSVQWRESNGTTSTSEFLMSPNGSGKWVIFAW